MTEHNENKNPRRGLGVLARNALCVVLAVCMLTGLTSAAYFSGGFSNGFAASGNVINVNTTMQRMASNRAYSSMRIVATSVSRDLAITVVNEKDEPIAGIQFEFRVAPVSAPQNVITTVDEDMDGQVYLSDLDAGDYTITMAEATAFTVPDPITATVAGQVSYQKVDVSDKIVSESEIDTSEEDVQYGGGPSNTGGSSSSAPTTTANTVEFVESSSKSETKTTETPVLDANGNQVVKYKPELSNGYLILADGTVSNILAVVDGDGYITGARRLDVGGEEAPEAPGGPEAPGVTNPDAPADTPAAPEAPPAEPTYTDVTSEVLNADGSPVKQGDSYKYKFTAVPQVTVKTETVTTYYGWQTLNGKTYYFDKNGKPVSGWQTINGVTYFFQNDGERGGSVGIDVSTWQDHIDWNRVKAAGIDFAIIRVGYRGYTKGSLVEDSMFRQNIRGATAAGLKVGVYFFSQAINEAEAVEEASMCIQLVQGYRLDYPIVIDVEDSGGTNGRADGLTADQRTRVCIAFCETVRNAGYTPCVYANKYYLTSKLYTSQFKSRGYVIWLAHYVSETSYTGHHIWQYSSTGKVPGVNGNVDMNISYLGY